MRHAELASNLHGASGYRYGCRCPLCRKAHRDYMRGYMRARRAHERNARLAYISGDAA